MAEECTLCNGKLPPGCLPRNSVRVRITERPDMILVVYCGRNATNQKKTKITFTNNKHCTSLLIPDIREKAGPGKGPGPGPSFPPGIPPKVHLGGSPGKCFTTHFNNRINILFCVSTFAKPECDNVLLCSPIRFSLTHILLVIVQIYG